MFVARRKLFNLTNSVVKSKILFALESTHYRTIVNAPNLLISKAHFSNDTKTPPTNNPSNPNSKSPLSTLFPKDEVDQKSIDNYEEDRKKSREANWRTMKKTLTVFGVSFTCLGIYLIIELGKPQLDDNGQIIRDDLINRPAVEQYLRRSYREMQYYIKLFEEPSREKLLPDPIGYPYYQPPYTLVLEITDVLVHPEWTYKTGWRFKKRPGIDRFLESVSPVYEVVIFTAEQGGTVFPLIDALDPKNLITYKLVRDATHFYKGHHVKDLNNLNRDLSKVIVIDWNYKNLKFHPQNLFQISRWYGTDNDTKLIDLATFLLAIADSEIEDVREVLKYYSKFEDPLEEFCKKHKMLVEKMEADRASKEQPPPPSLLKRWAPSIFNKPL